MSVAENLAGSAVYLAVLAGGYLLKRCGLFRREDAHVLSAVIMNITLPAAIIKGFSGVAFSGVLLQAFLWSAGVNAALLGAGALFSRGRPAVERGTSVLNTNTFNYGNFAIPFLSGSVGPDAFAAMCMFDVGAAVFTFGPNTALARRVMHGRSREQGGAGAVLKKMFTAPTFLVYLLMTVLSIVRLELPGFVMDVAQMAGSANAFLAMLCIGILFEFSFPREGRATVARVLAVRWAVCAAAAAALWFWAPLPRETARTLVIMLFAPVASCAPMLTLENGCDGTISAVINSVSVLAGIVIMTALLVLLPA